MAPGQSTGQAQNSANTLGPSEWSCAESGDTDSGPGYGWDNGTHSKVVTEPQRVLHCWCQRQGSLWGSLVGGRGRQGGWELSPENQ